MLKTPRSRFSPGQLCVRTLTRIAAAPRRFYSRFPLFDRYTFYYDSQYNLFTGLYMGIVAVQMQKLIARSLQANEYMIAFLVSSAFIGLLLNLITGHQASSRPKVRYAVRILLVARTAPIFMIFVTNAWGFVAIASVMNIFEFLFGSAYRSIQKINYSAAWRPKAVGGTRIILSLCVVISVYVASTVYDMNTLNIRFMYPIASIFGLLGVWRLSKIKVRYERPELVGGNRHSFLSIFDLLRHNRTFLFFMMALFILAFGNKIGQPVDAFRLRDELSISYKHSSYALSIAVHLSQIVGMLFWAKLASRYNPLRLLVFAGALLAARPISFALAPGQYETAVTVLVIGNLFYGFGLAGTLLMTMLSIYGVSHDDSRITAYLGLHFFLVGIRGLIGPYIGAYLLKHGMPTVHIYFLNTGIILTGVVLMLLTNLFAGQIARTNRLDRMTPPAT